MSPEEETRVKKLVLVLATFTSMTGAREETLECVLYIYYPVPFKDISKAQVQALINSKSKLNIIHPNFVKQLGLFIRSTDVGVQKIDGTMLNTHEMVIAAFLVVDKANRFLGCVSLPWVVQTSIFQVESSGKEITPPRKPSRLPNASS